MTRVFVLDNYDSFTFNLVQYLGSLRAEIDVARNDEVSVDEVAARGPDAVVISPGPGLPGDSGISIPMVEWCASSATPLLGVCLGHQAVAEAFGGTVVHAPTVMHGKTSRVHHDGSGVFAGLPEPFDAMRYHSLAVERASLPDELLVTAWTEDDVVMGLRHEVHAIETVQFHPESVLTIDGMQLLANFLATATATGRR
ncbi:MAG: aminodeoxychorismate/anthranilate synthase component II [Actinomycetota bacterium]